jgi:hypothetical protein
MVSPCHLRRPGVASIRNGTFLKAEWLWLHTASASRLSARQVLRRIHPLRLPQVWILARRRGRMGVAMVPAMRLAPDA